jgi:Rod binding domain-containing protein
VSPTLAMPLPLGDPDAARLDAVRRLPEGAARRAAAVELQVMFMTELLSAMRKTVPESDFLPRSPARSIYEGTFDRAVAQAIAARDPLGLVERLGQGLKEPAGPADK